MESLKSSKEVRLLEFYNNKIKNIPQLQLSLKEGRTNERFLAMTSWQIFQAFALKFYFIDKDINLAKLCFYKCGLLDELLVRKYDEKILDAGIIRLTYVLLSDNESLIERFSDLKHSTYPQTIQNGIATPTYALQCLLREDWPEFERAMAIIRLKTVPKFKMELDAAFYEALAEKNKLKIKEIISELLTPELHRVRNREQPLTCDFISHPALGYAKLAWIKGIEVDVDSPLVPMELLPVEPIKEYKELDLFDMQGYLS